MNDIEFGSKIILRTAGKPYRNFSYDNIKHDLKDPNFQVSIFFASESLFNELKKNDFIFEKLSPKIVFSLKKYYNRLHFRATPFAMFASTGLMLWIDLANSSPEIISKEISILPDFQVMLEMASLASSDNQSIYFPNNTIYGIKSEYRYLHYDFFKDTDSSKFKIFSFQNSALLKRILKYSTYGKTKQQIIEYSISLGQPSSESSDFVGYLISSGLLHSSLQPNYVGHSYFHKLITATDNIRLESREEINWKKIKEVSRNYKDGDILPLAELGTMNWPENIKSIKNKFYVNSFTKIDSGLDKKYQEQILNGLKWLDILRPCKTKPSLVDFVERFKKKFDRREIPLLHALDPETGIGYLSLEEGIYNDMVLEGIEFKKQSAHELIDWLPAHQLILKKLQLLKPFQPIQLDDQDMESMLLDKSKSYPPSFSVHFTVYNDFISIENAGGCSATTLVGRFTLNNEDLKLYNLQIAQQEQGLNPHVIFAEISCFMKDQIANVCTRESTYEYEIPILVNSTADQNHIIPLTDLFISIDNNEIILRSKKLKKIIIPRFTSVYNYNLHDLAIFRFLCDLQHQSIKTDFNFSFQKLFPGLEYYPRIVYKSTILHRALWILNEEQISMLLKSKNPEAACRKLFDKICIPTFFVIANHDNTLLFNKNSAADIKFFIQIIARQHSITIKEALISEKGFIVNDNKSPLIHEFVAPVFNTQASYADHIFPNKIYKVKGKRDFTPADEWLYYKIYCHTQAEDEILGSSVYFIINQLTKRNLIQQWFFVRYKDPETHLRLRLKAKPENIGTIMLLVNKAFLGRVGNGTISTIMLDTYKREMERYGAENIESLEKVFYKSSYFSINFFHSKNRNKARFSVFEVLIVSIDAIIDCYETDIIKKEEISESMYRQFSVEFSLDEELKHQLNAKYRKTKSLIENCLIQENKKSILSKLGKEHFAIIKTLLIAKPQSLKISLLTDIIHMHINRMINNDARKQEFVIYYLIFLHYRSSNRRNKTN